MNERDIFLAAIEIADAAERAAYVDEVCAGDAELRVQVQELLRTHAESSQFLESPAIATNSAIEHTIIADSTEVGADVQERSSSGESEFRKYLQPSTRPGWLGRLAHYEIEEILGRGAFGIVAKAFDEKLHRVVAIKLMSPELATTSPPRKRFLREARTAAAVTHENIVAIYAVEEEPIPYLVMEYIPGQTLQQRMEEHGPLELVEILRIGQQVAAGLAAADAANLIHRDIKPANILLTGGIKERAKISDFGLARAVDDATMTSSGVIAGTPLYMAPEQARGEPLDHRADLFSLGSVLYQMVSGRPPFRAANTVAVLKRVCEDSPRPLDDVIPETPDWLQAIIFRLLEKQRDDRYQTAQEVADLLARCQNELEHSRQVTCVPVGASAPDRTIKEPAEQTQLFSHAVPQTKPQTPARNHGVAYGIIITLIAVAFVLGISPRLARWFNTPIPSLPPVPPQARAAGLSFDGKDDWVEVTGLSWNYPQFTIEAFVTSAPNSDNGTIAYLGSGHGDNEEWMSLFDGAPGDAGKRISGAAVHGKTGYENAYGPFRGKERQHRALSYNGRYVDYYINGIWQGQRRVEPHEGGQWKMRELHIGCDGSGRKFFQGMIDQLRISRVARYSQNFELTTEFKRDDQTLALYRFDEDQGEVLKDHSGNGHDGKIKGAKWVNPVSTKSTDAAVARWHGWPMDAPPPAIAPFDAAQAKKYQEEWAAYLKVPVDYTNGLGMKFRLIPPGEFLMGSTPEEIEAALKDADPNDMRWQECVKSEAPQHKVILTQPTYLGVNEVTQAEYEKVLGVNPSHFAPTGMGQEAVVGLETAEHPVEMVSWNDAADFCTKLSQKEKLKSFYIQSDDTITLQDGTGYRLPSEAEWEYACRAGTTTKCWSDNEDADRLQVGWFAENGMSRTHPVGQLRANPFGLCDIHGNVWEWTQDSWDASWYGNSQNKPAINPQSPFSAGSMRVVRGSHLWFHLNDSRSSARHSVETPRVHGYLGFRVTLTVDAVRQNSARRISTESVTPNGWPADRPVQK